MEGIQCLRKQISRLYGKKVLFIATKNSDYLRITQEMRLLKKYVEKIDFIVSNKKNYFARILEVFLKTLFVKSKKYDLVFVGFQPQFIVPFFKYKLKKCELWVDFFISLYDTLVFDRKVLNPKSWIAKLARYFDEETLKVSDVIVCDTKAHGLFFAKEFHIRKSKLNVLYLQADKKIFYPRTVKKPKKLSDKYIVFYFGSILPLQGVDVVLKAAELLKDIPYIHFIIVGPIQKKIRKIQSETITYINWLPQEKLAKYIAFSDLCLAGHFSAEIDKANRTIPGKAYIYESMNKKMILGDSEANHERYSSNNVIFVPRGSNEKLAQAIKECFLLSIK